MPGSDAFKLENCDPDDISDVIIKVQKSFKVKFKRSDFKDVRTFGDFCDVVLKRIPYTNSNDCTSQQAFYKVRDAIAAIGEVEKTEVMLETKLADLFPGPGRMKQVKKLNARLGIPLNILGIKSWLSGLIAICFIVSFVGLFISVKFGLAAIAVSILIRWFAYRFAKELTLDTVRQLTQKVAIEQYAASRRNSETYNQAEVVKTIKQLFINDLEIDESTLSRESRF